MATYFNDSARFGMAALALLGWSLPASAAPQQVDVKLVMATDVSRSMDNEEFLVERDGTADAFLDLNVIQGIQNGALGRIAVAMFDFSSPEFDKVVVPWQIVHDRASAAAFAEAVRKAPRSEGHHTSISSALQFGALMLTASDKDIVATRKVIDVSGDGPNNFGTPMTEAHQKIIAQGIVVNGLPVMDDQANGYFPDLDKYYAGCVAGGRGAFVIAVHSYQDFSAGMRHKLILEISQNDTGIKQADNHPASRPLFTLAAETRGGPARPLEVLNAAPNEFSKECDIQGGFGGFGGYGGGRY